MSVPTFEVQMVAMATITISQTAVKHFLVPLGVRIPNISGMVA